MSLSYWGKFPSGLKHAKIQWNKMYRMYIAWQSLNVEYKPHAASRVIFLCHTFQNSLGFFSHWNRIDTQLTDEMLSNADKEAA